MNKFMTTGEMKRRVLVVDDEVINRELLGAMLSQTFDIAFASNGKEAMEALTTPEIGRASCRERVSSPV